MAALSVFREIFPLHPLEWRRSAVVAESVFPKLHEVDAFLQSDQREFYLWSDRRLALGAVQPDSPNACNATRVGA